MANPVNAFDFVTENLATFLAKSVGDGTYADLLNALKVDEAGEEAAATDIINRIGQLYGNVLDDFVQAAYPLLRAAALAPTTVMFSFGGFVSSTGLFLDAVSPSSGGVSFDRDEESSFLAPFDGQIVRAHLMLAAANVNQDWKIWVDDSAELLFETPSSTALTAQDFVSPVVMTAGQKLNLEFDAGTTTGNTRVDLFFQPS